MGDDPQPRDGQRLRAAKREARRRLLGLDGVQGVGIGDGTVRVYVRDAGVAAHLPADIDGVPVEVVPVGEVTAY